MSGCVPSRKVGSKAAIFRLLAIGFCFSSLLGFWFPGSAWEPYVLQALPAVFIRRDRRIKESREAEPRRRCVPRQSLGTSALLLAIGFCCSSLLGCSALSVRNDNCCGCSAPRQAEVFSDPGDENGEVSEPCDDNNYQPMLPQIPLPGCLHKWKEHQKLPDGPQGLKFHPLPTRPMFQPRPGALPLSPPWNCPMPNELMPNEPMPNHQASGASGQPAPLPIDSSGYGTIPMRSQWGELQRPSEGQGPVREQSDKSKPKVRVAPRVEELPKP